MRDDEDIYTRAVEQALMLGRTPEEHIEILQYERVSTEEEVAEALALGLIRDQQAILQEFIDRVAAASSEGSELDAALGSSTLGGARKSPK